MTSRETPDLFKYTGRPAYCVQLKSMVVSDESSIFGFNQQISDHEVKFTSISDTRPKDRVGVTKVMIEWNDYQSECFGELYFTKYRKGHGHTTVIHSKLAKNHLFYCSHNFIFLSQKHLDCDLLKSSLNLTKTLFN